jgi:hypothetical protein
MAFPFTQESSGSSRFAIPSNPLAVENLYNQALNVTNRLHGIYRAFTPVLARLRYLSS